jgi:phage protein D
VTASVSAAAETMAALGLGSDKHATTFHVPEFSVTVGGQELHGTNTADFLSVQFKDSIKELSSFEMSLNNWNDGSDGGERGFKYSDDDTRITLGQEVSLKMGYRDAPQLVEMMVGEITAFDPQFPAGGGPTVAVRGFDRLHRWRNAPRSFNWKNKTDSEIASEIAARHNMPVTVDDTRVKHRHVPQHNMDDVAFLLERAKRINFELFVRNDVLHFTETREGQEPSLTLEWGKSLISFSPSLTLAKQVSKVTVRSWHPKEGRLIEKSVDRAKLAKQGSGKNAGQVLDEALGEKKEEIITSDQVLSDEEAERLAESVLLRSSYAFVTGQGQTMGLPALRAGTNIRLTGLGKRFEGNYYVTESTHRIDGSGYTTSFGVRKVVI